MLPLYDKDIRNILSGEKANDVEDTLKDTEDMADDMSKSFCLLAQILISVHEGLGTSLKTNTRNDRHCLLTSNEDCFLIELDKALCAGTFSNVFNFIEKPTVRT